MAIEDLIPYHNNPKEHPQEQVDKIASSIKNFGFTVPLVIDGDKEVIMGHGRLEAARKLGMEEVPCIVRDDLTDAEARALRIADNKVAESEWDLEALEVEFEALDSDALTGFDIDELQEFGDNGEAEEDDFDVDAALEEQEEPTVQEGEIWQLGRHRVMCGDSTKKEDVARLMVGEKADMVFTDPPYGVNYVGGTAEALKMDNDSTTEVAVSALRVVVEFLKEGGSFYLCYPAEELEALGEVWAPPLRLQSLIVWVKDSIVMGRKDHQYRHEPIWYGWKKGSAHYFVDDRTNETVWEMERPRENKEHPTMKPIGLCARAIKNSSKQGWVVLDLFGGSGSTMVAAHMLDRKCYMMEIDPHYATVILKRMIELEPELEVYRDGERYDTKNLH